MAEQLKADFVIYLNGLPLIEQNKLLAGLKKEIQLARAQEVQRLEAEIQKIKVGMEDLEKMVREA